MIFSKGFSLYRHCMKPKFFSTGFLSVSDVNNSPLLSCVLPCSKISILSNNSVPVEISSKTLSEVFDLSDVGAVNVELADGSTTTWPVSPAIVLDVRNPDELDTIARVPDNCAWIHIPLGEIKHQYLSKLQPIIDKMTDDEGNEPVVLVHCAKGIRSAKAVNFLKEQGVRCVSVSDGIENLPNEWKQKGL